MMTSLVCATCPEFRTCGKLNAVDRAMINKRALEEPILVAEIDLVLRISVLTNSIPWRMMSPEAVDEVRRYMREEAGADRTAMAADDDTVH